MYNNCPTIWVSNVQTSVALSTCEAEYIAMSTVLCEVIPLMRLLDTIVDVWNINTPQPHVVVHEDKQSACQLAMNKAYKPGTRHVAVKYHHFHDYVDSSCIRIDYIHTNEQTADILTKALPKDSFAYLIKETVWMDHLTRGEHHWTYSNAPWLLHSSARECYITGDVCIILSFSESRFIQD
jgi:hypothetical protein